MDNGDDGCERIIPAMNQLKLLTEGVKGVELLKKSFDDFVHCGRLHTGRTSDQPVLPPSYKRLETYRHTRLKELVNDTLCFLGKASEKLIQRFNHGDGRPRVPPVLLSFVGTSPY